MIVSKSLEVNCHDRTSEICAGDLNIATSDICYFLNNCAAHEAEKTQCNHRSQS